MLQNAYFLAKIGADTAENEEHFDEILPKTGNYARRSLTSSRSSWAESARGWERKDPPMLGLIDYLAVVSIQVLAIRNTSATPKASSLPSALVSIRDHLYVARFILTPSSNEILERNFSNFYF